jgi:hypothetical protein
MEGLGQSIGNGFSRVMGGILDSILHGLAGIVDAAGDDLPSAPIFDFAFVAVVVAEHARKHGAG